MDWREQSCSSVLTRQAYYVYLSSQGLAVKAYGFEVRAPTGHRSVGVSNIEQNS